MEAYLAAKGYPVIHRGPGWLHVGPLSPREQVEAQRVTMRLLALWNVRLARWRTA